MARDQSAPPPAPAGWRRFLPPWLLWFVKFAWDNFLSSLWATYAGPIGVATIVVIAAILTNWTAPYVVLGGAAGFGFTAWASAEAARRRYFIAAKEHLRGGGSVGALVVPTSVVMRRGGAPPRLVVEPHDGREGILLVRNEGGDAVLMAKARVISAEKQPVGHTAPYLMLWRNAETHAQVSGHKVFVSQGGTSKVRVSAVQYGGIGSRSRYLQLFGDNGVVDQYEAYGDSKTPVAEIEVEITSEPGMELPYSERFVTFAPANQLNVTVERLKAKPTP